MNTTSLRPSRATRRPLSILVVDDDSVDYLLLTRYLAHAEISAMVKWANNFAGAQSMLNAGVYDLIILDQYLGSRLGTDLVELARQTSASGRVILVSGCDVFDVAQAALVAGVDELLAKADLEGPVLARLIDSLLLGQEFVARTPASQTAA